MSGAAYYSCDVCHAKTFYDAGLKYITPIGDRENYHPVTNKLWPSGNVGWMTVLCRDCAAKYRVEIAREEL